MTTQWISYSDRRPTEANFPFQTKGRRGYENRIRIWLCSPNDAPFDPKQWKDAYWAPYTEPLPPKTQAELDKEAYDHHIRMRGCLGHTPSFEDWMAALNYARK